MFFFIVFFSPRNYQFLFYLFTNSLHKNTDDQPPGIWHRDQDDARYERTYILPNHHFWYPIVKFWGCSTTQFQHLVNFTTELVYISASWFVRSVHWWGSICYIPRVRVCLKNFGPLKLQLVSYKNHSFLMRNLPGPYIFGKDTSLKPT